MRAMFIIGLVTGALTASSGALASAQCTNEPASKWIPEAEMKNRIAAMGHSIEIFKKVRGNCYEIYGRNKEGRRIEIYFNPVTGDIVKENVE